MKLLEPIKVGKITLKNRVMFPPLTTGYEEQDGSIGEQSLSFYKRLAEGGVGYIVIGDVVPVPTVSPTPKLFMDSQIPSFKRLADAVHEYGCKLGLQIFHPDYDAEGLIKMIKDGKSRPEVFAKLHYDMTHFVNEVTKEQLDVILDRIEACSKRAVAAGVDVIEVHGDRLIGSLTSTILNKRRDEFGGSFENRVKLALMVVDRIKRAAPNMTIDYKLPIVMREGDLIIGKGGLFLDEAVRLAKLLEQHGVDTIHVAQANHTGNMNDTIPAMGTRAYSFMEEACLEIKRVCKLPLSLVGRIIDVERGEKLLNDGVCDIVAYGRPLLTDPDIVNKCIKGQEALIRKCICCNKGCTDAIQARKFLSCILNAENGYEYKRVITKAKNPKNCLVIGGGIAGVEAARVLEEKGHTVTIIEKANRLYGQLNIASVPPRKSEMLRICDYYDEVLKRSKNIKVILNHEFKKEDAKGFDEVIAAVGATNAHPQIPGIDKTIDAWEVLAGRMPKGEGVVICGGGLVGVETAEYLAEKGYRVTIIEMMDKIAKEESNTIMPTLMANLKRYNVNVLVNHKIKRINKNAVICSAMRDNLEIDYQDTITGDVIINALASHKEHIDLEGVEAHISYIGDCMADSPCNIDNAIKSAYDAANSIN